MYNFRKGSSSMFVVEAKIRIYPLHDELELLRQALFLMRLAQVSGASGVLPMISIAVIERSL